jgi:hypothetical protein
MSLSNYNEIDRFQQHSFIMLLVQDILSDGSRGYSIRIEEHVFPYSDEDKASAAFADIKRILEIAL